MEFLIVVMIVLFVVMALVTVLGHAMWLVCAAVVESLTTSERPQSAPNILRWRCDICNSEVRTSWEYCGTCGAPKPSGSSLHVLKELAVVERFIERLLRENKIGVEIYEALKSVLVAERTNLTTLDRSPVVVAQPEPIVTPIREDKKPVATSVPSIPPFFNPTPERVVAQTSTEQPKPARKPRRSFTEVLNSFMEESNIRWGEIIGGLLIIGCSTALVVSLWSQISQIPVLKFLIFTTVTAILFGVGMYTEHRWKLPTTSRGILTIATLLVPLNFLAIAAVSSGETSGVLVLASELLAPAIFLCLVYFAGRIITPGCAHLLAAGVLGSSVGQLLVRHFATVDAAPGLQVLLGAFPVVCYIVAVAFALRRVLADRRIDETETTTVFTILGTMSFAALLPFGLLLYKSGPLAMSMMYLAPIVTLWGVPMLATGTVLWRRIDNKELVASRTAGTALGILGLMIALAGMILAWPNPASIIPAALFNVAILTTLAIVLEIQAAHAVAAGCFGLAYLVFFHVATGRVGWENWRVDSLVNISLDISSGQALIGAFVIFLIVAEWLRRAAETERVRRTSFRHVQSL
jgi:hypothetical protein